MSVPEDVGGALRAVWEVRRAEERFQYCIGAWENVIFGVMAAVIFASYGVAGFYNVQGPLLSWLWLPPVLGAYTALAFVTKSALRLPRPTLPWGEIALGTALFVGLMGLLALALLNGLLRDIPAGMSIVVGSFYIILGLVFLRERMPALFGFAIAAGALALVLLRAGMVASTIYGIVATGGGMIAMGVWMLRHPERGAPPVHPGEEGDRPPELQKVREALRGIRLHEELLRAREGAAKIFLLAALLALAGVTGFLSGPPPYSWALLGLAGLALGVGFLRQRAALREAPHGA